MINKDGKILSRFNVIDILVVLVIILSAIGLSLRFNTSKTKELSQIAKFKYEMKIDNIRQCTVDALNKQGDTFSDANNIKTGKITGVTVEPYKKEIKTSSGALKTATVPERFTAYVTIEVEGQSSDNKYYDSDKTDISIGRGHNLCTKYVWTSGEIISLEDVK